MSQCPSPLGVGGSGDAGTDGEVVAAIVVEVATRHGASEGVDGVEAETRAGQDPVTSKVATGSLSL